MRLVYFDCVGGAAGDMLLGALIDAGAPAAAIEDGLGRLPVGGYRLVLGKAVVGAFAATRLEVEVTEPQPHRTLPEIQAIIAAGRLPAGAEQRAEAVFQRLAAAEARVHASTVEAVHFHEVGAVDAIVDIVGTALALEHLGIDSVRFGILEPGQGTVNTAHGLLPVPTPATLELLHGIPIRLGGEAGEWVTPTGAALLTTLGQPLASGPTMRVEGIGIGCGSRSRRERPNIVRALVGDWVGEEPAVGAVADDGVACEEITVLEAAIDDLTPEALAHAAERIRESGARDVLLIPVVMKKGRSGVNLQVLAAPADAERLARLMLAETSTLGVRLRREERRLLARAMLTVSTPYGSIRIKETVRPLATGAAHDAAPEAADVAQAARHAGVSFSTVAAAAWVAYRQLRPADEVRPGGQ